MNYIVQDGQFISTEVQRVVEAIHDYDPRIETQWIPQAARSEGQSAFKIVYHDPCGVDFTLFHVKDESEFDLRVLYRIIANDQRNGSPTLTEYEAWEQTIERMKMQAWRDELDQATDIAYHVFKSPLNTYKVNDGLVFKEDTPFNAAPLSKQELDKE